jgi:hypothetical protein
MKTIRINLPPGTALSVGTLDENGNENDGEIIVEHDPKAITVRTEWPDDSGREGELYRVAYGILDEDDDVKPAPTPRDPWDRS